MTTKVPLCVDCRFFGGPAEYKETGRAICHNPANKNFDPVWGRWVDYDATWLRSPSHVDKCGPDGKWWEAAACP